MSDAPKHRQLYFAPNVVDVLAERAVVPRGSLYVCAKCGGKLLERSFCVACAAQASLDKKLARKRELMAQH